MIYFIILIILTYSVVMQLYSSNLFYTIIMTSLSSLSFTILYLYFKSPDVAVTEATIGSSISIIISMILLTFIRENQAQNKEYIHNRIAMFYTFVGCFLFSYIFIYSTSMNFIDFINYQLNESAYYYVNNVDQDYNGLKNVVTGILGGYRSFDSFMELCVIVFGARLIGQILQKD